MKPDFEKLDRAFNPRVVVVVGDKKAEGYRWLRSLSTLQGEVYSVQIDPAEIPNIEALGVKNYLSLLDVPAEIDYVIVAVPRPVAPRVLEDCIQKGVGAVSFFTSGFAETGTEEGRRLQDILARRGREAGINLVGPNCMGIFNPRLGLRFTLDQEAGQRGRVGFIAQSGTHLSYMSTVGPINGIRLSKGVSYGNAIVLDSPDYMDYMLQDEETEIIALYIEGVKDGRRFFRSLREAARRKPVLIWKGGETEDGTRATASHTGSLAESPLVWQALIRQGGAIKVDNLEEMIDTLGGLLYFKPPRGNRVGLVALSGGQSVIITDAFARAGLRVPDLASESYQELADFYNIIGGSYRNPFDVSPTMSSLDNLTRILNILDRDENIDSVALEISSLFMFRRWEKDPTYLDTLADTLAEFKSRSLKPFFIILVAGNREVMAVEARERFVSREIATFPSFRRAAEALGRVVEYYRSGVQGDT
ncbi:MAG: CoA-binding protein [Dehalococcoidia bacterium]